MRLIACVLALTAVFAAPAALADDGPESGGYMLVDTVLDGIEAGLIVPIFTHVEVTITPEGGHMEFTFFSSYAGDSMSCEMQQKCERAVNALGLDFATDDDGRLAVTDADIRTGPGLTIDRADVDEPFIIRPMIALIDGAQATWSKNEIVLAPQDWPAGRTARFLSADLDDAYDALAFALGFEVALYQLDHCVIRQVMEIANRSTLLRSEADRELLDAVHFAGAYTRLDDRIGYWAFDRDNDPRDPAEVSALQSRISLVRVAMAYVPYQDGEDSVAAIEEGIGALRDRIDDFEAVYADFILPNLDGIVAMRRMMGRYAAIIDQGYDPVESLCRSVHLDF